VIALVVAVMPGCGGSGAQQLTKEQFASGADAICAKGNERQKELGTPTNVAELARAADKTREILDEAISEVGKLKPPPSEQAKVDQWLAQVRVLRDDLKQIRDKAEKNDVKGLRKIGAISKAHNAKANALATDLGMSVCNQG
jgi:hypothetical protein